MTCKDKASYDSTPWRQDILWLTHTHHIGMIWSIDEYTAHLYTAYGGATISRLLKITVSFAKEPYKRDYILRKRPIILRGLLIVGTAYHYLQQTRMGTLCWYCNTLQHTATDSNGDSLLILQQTATQCNRLERGLSTDTATHCNTMQQTRTGTLCWYCNTLQHTAPYYDILQHTATHGGILRHSCKTLQHTVSHCASEWFPRAWNRSSLRRILSLL